MKRESRVTPARRRSKRYKRRTIRRRRSKFSIKIEDF